MSMSNGFLSQEEIDSLLNGSDDSSSNTGSNDNSVNLLSEIFLWDLHQQPFIK